MRVDAKLVFAIVMCLSTSIRGESDIRVLRFLELTQQPGSEATAPRPVQQALYEEGSPNETIRQTAAQSASLESTSLETAIPTAGGTSLHSSPPAAPFVPMRPRAMAYVQPGPEPLVTNQTRQALGFYGGHSARATLNQLPRRAPLQSTPAQTPRRAPKPFEVVQHEPTVSPYLNLYRDEDHSESAPNYFAFVRPQMEQLEANRAAQRELHYLRSQVQGMSPTVAGPRYQGGVPGTGSAARYMDTAQFYGGRR